MNKSSILQLQHPSTSFEYDPHLPTDVFNVQRANFLSVKDAFCQTSDCETTATQKQERNVDQQPFKRSYDHRRATDSLLQPTEQKNKEANPLMVRTVRSGHILKQMLIGITLFSNRSALAAVRLNAVSKCFHRI